jgi:anti-anti-sigma regulatory factor
MRLFSKRSGVCQPARLEAATHFIVEERVEGRDRVLLLRGFADILCIPMLQRLLRQYRKEKIRLLLIDLSKTEFINSPVWAAITLYACQNRPSPIVAIVNMSERIRGSFEMMGLYEELPTFPTIEAAKQQLTVLSNDH